MLENSTTENDAALDVAPYPSTQSDLIMAAWGLIANANEGDWTKATDEWVEAANRWRDGFGVWLDDKVDNLVPHAGQS